MPSIDKIAGNQFRFPIKMQKLLVKQQESRRPQNYLMSLVPMSPNESTIALKTNIKY